MSVSPEPYNPKPARRDPPDDRPELVGIETEQGRLALYESAGDLEAYLTADCWVSIHHDKPPDETEIEVEWL